MEEAREEIIRQSFIPQKIQKAEFANVFRYTVPDNLIDCDNIDQFTMTSYNL